MAGISSANTPGPRSASTCLWLWWPSFRILEAYFGYWKCLDMSLKLADITRRSQIFKLAVKGKTLPTIRINCLHKSKQTTKLKTIVSIT